ncbi:hypothetical protein GH714_026352 [Hevea brasiliensis]|uniref:B box-type domain-containing protein n=1 Tax=Hevea brasiliensis TaxID=3981 RepID=A0A6A6MQH6_HEVBR|nr:hypothetical protein GH714_026352 [Hevea brasiliensis]
MMQITHLIQETAGFFFCLEDRALLCRKCDVAIHTANAYVSAHQRFLLTGVKVGLEPTDPGASSSSGKSPSGEKTSETKSHYVSRRGTPMPLASPSNEVLPAQVVGQEFEPVKVSFSGGSAAGDIPQWQMDEFLGLTGFSQNYSYVNNGSSKADSGKRSDSDSSAILRSAEEEVDDDDECLGQVPDSSWAVPQIPSPPTASGLYWPKRVHNQSDNGEFVPDICCSTVQNHHHRRQHGSVTKRQRL